MQIYYQHHAVPRNQSNFSLDWCLIKKSHIFWLMHVLWWNVASKFHFSNSADSTKPYASPVHPAVSPASSLEERRSTNSPAVRSDSSSPAPPSGEDPENKKHTQAKVKGKPKLTTGAAKPEIKCEQCGKTFGSSSALAKHKLTHSDERRYICSTCGKGFKRQDHLWVDFSVLIFQTVTY